MQRFRNIWWRWDGGVARQPQRLAEWFRTGWNFAATGWNGGVAGRNGNHGRMPGVPRSVGRSLLIPLLRRNFNGSRKRPAAVHEFLIVKPLATRRAEIFAAGWLCNR
jgi:hypothetical protein